MVRQVDLEEFFIEPSYQCLHSWSFDVFDNELLVLLETITIVDL